MVINFDANASTALLPEVSEALRRLGCSPLNPSAVHRLGQRARAFLEEAREEVRLLVDAPSSARVVFTSGATEANNHALSLRLSTSTESRGEAGAEIVTSAVEHLSVLEAAQAYGERGVTVAIIPVEPNGDLSQAEFINALGPRTRIVSLMRANNETGQLSPISKLVNIVRERAPQALFHSDTVQAIGKIPVSMRELGVDALSLSGHKIGALPGIGALVLSENVRHESFLKGGAQEQRWRAGTENTFGIISLGLAAREVRKKIADRQITMERNTDIIAQELMRALPDIQVNTRRTNALPNTLNVTLPGVRADDLVVALDLEGVCISSGAACSSGKPEPSHVLRAMGLSDERARQTIRISLEAEYPAGEVEKAAATLVRAIVRMKGEVH